MKGIGATQRGVLEALGPDGVIEPRIDHPEYRDAAYCIGSVIIRAITVDALLDRGLIRADWSRGGFVITETGLVAIGDHAEVLA